MPRRGYQPDSCAQARAIGLCEGVRAVRNRLRVRRDDDLVVAAAIGA